MNFYNENDPKAAAWLRELIKGKLIPDGMVDERSITEIRAHELSGFTQCHFFAGIGGWSYALRLGGWPEDRPVWTGSCPCQPWSAAGDQLGELDPRHLWPAWFRLIAQCDPSIIFGEQVASKSALRWLDGVFADLEGKDYACAAADLCAAGIGAPHIRQRLYWVANACCKRRQQICRGASCNEVENGREQNADNFASSGGKNRAVGLADSERDAGEPGRIADQSSEGARASSGRTPVESGRCCLSGWMGHPECPEGARLGRHGREVVSGHEESNGCNDSNPWERSELLPCADGKSRRIEPGTFPLANGIPGRVGLLRGYGNAIVPQVAAEFIKASIEALAL